MEPLVSFLKTPLFYHQRQAIEFILDHWPTRGVLLAHEMGTGKTLTALAACAAGGTKRLLVICPLSVKHIWNEQLEEHLVWRPEQFVVLNYEIAWRQKIPLGFEPDTVILDESHRIKHHQTRQAMYCHLLALKVPRRLALTGTPITQTPLDIWSQLRFVQRDIFSSSYYAFRNRYADVKMVEPKAIDPATKKKRKSFPVIRKYQNLDELRTKLATVMHRVSKDETLDLPEKTHVVRLIPLSDDERNAYRSMRDQALLELSALESVTAPNLLAQLTRLSQITSGFIQYRDPASCESSGIRRRLFGSSKLHELVELLTGDLAGEPVVVFVRWLSDLRRISEALFESRLLLTMDGATPPEERQRIVADFSMNEQPLVLVTMQQVGGLGITLTRASHAIFYGLSWSVAEWLQAQDRIHRIGQTRPCTYTYLLAEKTIDEVIYRSLRTKTELADQLVNWKEILADAP